MSSLNRPLLSIVATARNDNHGGNLLRRVQIFVSAICAQADRHQVPVELILVDWNPPQDKPPLSAALQWPNSTYCTARVVEVPNKLHSQFKYSERLPLYQMIGKNVGVRRARGEFVLATNIDILFSDELFALFKSDRFKKGFIYRTDRHDIDENIPLNASIAEQLRFCESNIVRVQHYRGTALCADGSYYPVYPDDIEVDPDTWNTPLLHTNACGDFQLMAREHWFALKGYPELEMYSFHIDSLMMFMAHYAGIREDYLKDPYRIYHIDHTGGFIPESGKVLDETLQKTAIPRMSDDDLKAKALAMHQQRSPVIENSDAWGLGENELLESVPCRASWDSNNVKPNSQPYFSIVVTARNDNHGGNLLHRIQAFVNTLAQQARKYSLSCELVIVEWNPPKTEASLSTAIQWPSQLPFEVNLIEVGSDIHNRLLCSESIPLFQWVAKNVGIRRARGEFVLSTNIDILFSNELIEFLAKHQLDKNCFYRVCRYDVGDPCIPLDTTPAETIQYCLSKVIRVHDTVNTRPITPEQCAERSLANASEMRPEYLHAQGTQKAFTNASGDFTLMAREGWNSIRGHSEIARADLHLDSLAIHMAEGAGIKQVILPEPMRVFHIEHGGSWAVQTSPRSIERKRLSLDYCGQVLPWAQAMDHSKQIIQTNGENWGLVSENLEQRGLFNNSEKAFRHSPFVEGHGDDILSQSLFHYQPSAIFYLGTSSEFESFTARIKNSGISQKVVHVRDTFLDVLNKNHVTPERALVYVSSTSTISTEYIRKFLECAKKLLAYGSIIVVDNIWISNSVLGPANIAAFLSEMRGSGKFIFTNFFGVIAPYWMGGSFLGGPALLPFLEWVNCFHLQTVLTQKSNALVFDLLPGNETLHEKSDEFLNYVYTISVKEESHGLLNVRLDTKAQNAFVQGTIKWKHLEPTQALSWLSLAREALECYCGNRFYSSLNRLQIIEQLDPPLAEIQPVKAEVLSRLGLSLELYASTVSSSTARE